MLNTNQQPKETQHQQIQRLVLENGITLIVVENPTADIIAGRIFLKNAGSRWEKPELAGLSHLLALTLTKGTEKLVSAEIAEKVESMGASLGADAAADHFALSMKTVAADFPAMFKLVGEIMRTPTFPPSEIELEKHQTIQNIRSQRESPFNVAFEGLRCAMYPNHPYGVSILGKEATVSQITRADLQQYHQTYFRPDNLVISLSGRLSLENGIKIVEEVLGDWSAPTTAYPKLQIPELEVKPCQRAKPQETQQSIVMLGYLGDQIQSKDYAALKLLSTYLGNGLSSRLFVQLREKRGLAYDVSAFYPSRLDRSQFVVYMGTAPENTAVAVEGLGTEVERLSQVNLTEAELQGAKNKLLGQYALGKQTNGEIAQIFGWYESLGLGIEFVRQFQEDIAEVTTEMARTVAQRYLTEPYISLVGPEKSIM
ncbi:MAG: insulinase family protein [Prochloron sp. SP5CPC1]|nr:insulinase family protein [Candidatus Paraprochloron terpiosi SP5CPC1]